MIEICLLLLILLTVWQIGRLVRDPLEFDWLFDVVALFGRWTQLPKANPSIARSSSWKERLALFDWFTTIKSLIGQSFEDFLVMGTCYSSVRNVAWQAFPLRRCSLDYFPDRERTSRAISTP